MKLNKNELSHSGVGKMLVNENQQLKAENKSLRKSLSANQDELEKLRSENHALDKKNSLLDYRLHTAVLPELLKFFASSLGMGFAVSFFFNNQTVLGVISFVVSGVIYGTILFVYKK